MSVHEASADGIESVLDFWFDELKPSQHFANDPALDDDIGVRFSGLHTQAAASELWRWRDCLDGRLAEIILLDQFSRNIYRDQPAAFASDPLALCLAQAAVRLQLDRQLPPTRRAFLYMPYMHSESRAIQAESVRLFNQVGMEDNYRFAIHHRDIVERFGRYPHRNRILGRESTPEEEAFLLEPGSSF